MPTHEIPQTLTTLGNSLENEKLPIKLMLRTRQLFIKLMIQYFEPKIKFNKRNDYSKNGFSFSFDWRSHSFPEPRDGINWRQTAAKLIFNLSKDLWFLVAIMENKIKKVNSIWHTINKNLPRSLSQLQVH